MSSSSSTLVAAAPAPASSKIYPDNPARVASISPALSTPHTAFPPPRRSALSTLSIRLARRLGLILAAAIVLTILGWSFFPTFFASGSPYETHIAQRLMSPSLTHWFGTDYLGRDIYTRVVFGAALSLKATVIAVLIGFAVGSLTGLFAGFIGGLVDDLLMRVIDVLLAIPSLLLSLTIITVLGFGTVHVACAVGVTTVGAFARVMRAEVRRVRVSDFVEAAALSGVRWPSVLFRHVLPNAWGQVLALAGLECGAAVLAVSALSFLGFGAAPPAPEWGSLIAEGRTYLANAWWLTTMPGAVVVAAVMATNVLGRSLGDANRLAAKRHSSSRP